MKHRVCFAITLLVLQFGGGGIARADDKVLEKPVTVADTPEKFSAVVDEVHENMRSGGRYEFIHADNRARAEGDMEKIQAMLQKAGSVATMSPQEKVELFNLQENLNGILVHSDRNRLVCERRAAVGTNIPLNTCKTVAEIEKTRHDSQKYLLDHGADANINSAATHKESGERIGH